MRTEPLLASVLDYALRAGAQEADVLVVERESLSLSWRLGELQAVERKESWDLGLRVIVDGRQGCAATSRDDRSSLEALVDELVASTRRLPLDPFAGLAAPSELAREVADLDLLDPAEPDLAQLTAIAGEAEAAARAHPAIENSDGASAGWSRSTFRLAASNGFSGTYRRSSHWLGVTVLAGQGTAMERDSEWRQATHRADLPEAASIGRTAAERTVGRLGPRKVDSASVPVVFEPRVASSLLRHLAGLISGDAVAKGSTFLKDAVGEPLFGPDIVISDDPSRRRGAASRPFDAEGLPGAPRRLVDAGVLTGFLLDCSTGRRLGKRSSGHASRAPGGPPSPAATNLALQPGSRPPAQLMGDIKDGFYVTDLMGMGLNPITGDYSRGAAGFWIRDGELAYPVSEVTIAGNLRPMFGSLTVADDLELRGSCDAPTVRVEGMTVAGR